MKPAILLLAALSAFAQSNQIQLCDQDGTRHCMTIKAPSTLAANVTCTLGTTGFGSCSGDVSNGFLMTGNSGIASFTALGALMYRTPANILVIQNNDGSPTGRHPFLLSAGDTASSQSGLLRIGGTGVNGTLISGFPSLRLISPGGVVVVEGGNLEPDGNGTRTLGGSALRWNALLNNVNVVGATTQSVGSSFTMAGGSTFTLGNSMSAVFGSDVLPDVTGTRAFGDATFRFGNAWIDNIYTQRLRAEYVSGGSVVSYHDIATTASNILDVLNSSGAVLARYSGTSGDAWTFRGHIDPHADNSNNLGTSVLRFKDLFAMTGDYSTTLNVRNTGTFQMTSGAIANVAAHWRPGDDGVWDLGTTLRQWKDLFMTGEIVQGGATRLDASGNLTVTSCSGCGGTSLPFADNVSLLKNNADNTKQMRFDLGGISSGATRVLTLQNGNHTVAATNLSQTFSSTQTFTGSFVIGTSTSTSVGSDFLPDSSGARALGTTGLRWNGIFNNTSTSGTGTYSLGSTLLLATNSNFTTGTGVALSLNIDWYPGSDNTHDLGTASLQWNNVRWKGSLIQGSTTRLDGSGNATVNNITIGGTCTGCPYLPLAGGTLAGTLNGRDVIPTTDATYTLGDSTHTWHADLFNARMYGTLTIRNGAATTFSNGSTLNVNSGSTANVSIDWSPSADNTYDLGTASLQWNDIRLKGALINGSTTLINSGGAFVGAGVDVGSHGVGAGGFNPVGGYTGQTATVTGTFTIGGMGYTQLVFRGGVLVSYN